MTHELGPTGPPAVVVSPDGQLSRRPGPIDRPRSGLPRALIIVLGLAAGVVVVAGMRAIPDIIGPMFMALVLTITVNPIRYWLIRRGASRGVASLAVFLTVLAIVVGLFAAAVVGIVQLATLMPQYADQIQQQLRRDPVAGSKAWASARPTSSRCSAAWNPASSPR